MITVDEAGENIITVAPGANHEVGAPEIAVISESAEAAGAGSANVLVISAEVPVPAILAALAAAGAESRDAPAARPRRHRGSASRSDTEGPRGPRWLTVLNLAPAPPRAEAAGILAARPDWLVVNESEAAAVLARPVSGLAEAASAAADLVAAGARNAVVTAGAAGAAYHGAKGDGEGQEPRGTVAAFPVRAVDTVGRATRSWARSRWRSRPGSPRRKRSPPRRRPAPRPRPGRAPRPGCPVPPTFAPRPVTSGHSPSVS